MKEQQVAGNENVPAQARGVWASPGELGEPKRGLKSAGTAQKEGGPATEGIPLHSLYCR